MKLIPLYLSCLLTVVVTGSELKVYCYDPPGLSCTEQHILDCDEGQVITTDITGFHVAFVKNRNFPECQTEKDECKNKTTCCRYINSTVSVQEIILLADDNTLLINFIKNKCSSKSSCIVSSYYNTSGGPDLYDYVAYNYGCISAKDEITVDFLVNGSTYFTGNSFPTVYYLDYTGNGTKEDYNETILNRECIITTTEKDITLKIKKLNLQADDCCRFHISGHKVPEYCSQSGTLTPPKGKNIGKNTATISLENVENKYGDNFSIIVKAAGNVTIDCRTFEQVDKQEPTTCQYPTPESTSITKSSTSPTTGKDLNGESVTKKLGMEKKETKYSESDLGAIIGGTVGGLVFLNIIFIIIVVLIVRRKLRAKQTPTDEIQHYSSLDGLSNSPEHNYVGMETTSPTRA